MRPVTKDQGDYLDLYVYTNLHERSVFLSYSHCLFRVGHKSTRGASVSSLQKELQAVRL